MLFRSGVVARAGVVRLGEDGHEIACETGAVPPGAAVTLGIRPEHVRLAPGEGLPLYIELVERLGGESYLYGASPGLPQVTLKLEGQSAHQRGETVQLALPAAQIHLFDEAGRAVRT